MACPRPKREMGCCLSVLASLAFLPMQCWICHRCQEAACLPAGHSARTRNLVPQRPSATPLQCACKRLDCSFLPDPGRVKVLSLPCVLRSHYPWLPCGHSFHGIAPHPSSCHSAWLLAHSPEHMCAGTHQRCSWHVLSASSWAVRAGTSWNHCMHSPNSHPWTALIAVPALLCTQSQQPSLHSPDKCSVSYFSAGCPLPPAMLLSYSWASPHSLLGRRWQQGDHESPTCMVPTDAVGVGDPEGEGWGSDSQEMCHPWVSGPGTVHPSWEP